MTDQSPFRPLSSRHLLSGLAASPIAALGVGSFAAPVRARAQAAGLISPNVCMVSPETTEGPCYLDPDLMRADITEDRKGVPMRFQMQVVTADCQPIKGARVDVWHCDASGVYSGYRGRETGADLQSETFLRGTQVSDARGIVTFQTIYPGWYRGRTTHVHYKVFLDERTVLTSQVFFPDALSEYLFQSVAPYNLREARRDTMNGSDRIAWAAGEGAFAAIREQKEYYDAALVVGVSGAASVSDADLPPRGGSGRLYDGAEGPVYIPGKG